MNNEYCLVFLDDETSFEKSLEDAIGKAISKDYWKDFQKYHFSGLEDKLAKIISKAIYEGGIKKDDECEVVENGIKFEVKGTGYSLPPRSYDVVMTVERGNDKYITDITFKGLVIRLRKENVEFPMGDVTLNKKEWNQSEWRGFEKLFGFEYADSISFRPGIVTGFGVLKEKDENANSKG